jgi:hypothetical protein
MSAETHLRRALEAPDEWSHLSRAA